MKVAIAQINAHLGNFSENSSKIKKFITAALDRNCELVVFPECALMGYHPVDLLERPSVVDEQLKALKSIEKFMPQGITAIIGAITESPYQNGKPYQNSAVVLAKGEELQIFAKQLLPTYDVFDESRHIEPGEMHKNIFRYKDLNIFICICEDIWAWPNPHHGKRSPYKENPIEKISSHSVDLVINLSASPFTPDKVEGRLAVCQQTSAHFSAPMIYANLVGAQDEVIYDGGSFAIDQNQNIFARCLSFEEDINVIDLEQKKGWIKETVDPLPEKLRRAIVLGIRDFVSKTGFKSVHLGLSGGIDSALVACLAVDALGSQSVSAIAMPGPYNRKESLVLARNLAKNLGIKLYEVPIKDLYRDAKKQVDLLGKTPFGLVHENLQARLRGLLLMAYSNKNSSLLMNTSNKSELATGYSTLYGDMAGGLCPIGDLLKTDVFALSKYYNREQEIIPQRIIDRAPSAELRPNQSDQDSLPDYKVLDKEIQKMVEQFKPARSPLSRKVLNMMMSSEFKRWQSPPILKVSNHAFGLGRRLPIAHKAYF